jgi:hypothetical protein
MRLITEFGPRGRSAGRYCGNWVAEADDAGLAEAVAAGLVAGDADGFEAGDAAGLEGVAEGFVWTCTSAAKTIPAQPTAATANQNLNIECLRNAVLALSQDQFLLPR